MDYKWYFGRVTDEGFEFLHSLPIEEVAVMDKEVAATVQQVYDEVYNDKANESSS